MAFLGLLQRQVLAATQGLEAEDIVPLVAGREVEFLHAARAEKLLSMFLLRLEGRLPDSARRAFEKIVDRQQQWAIKVCATLAPGSIFLKGPTIDHMGLTGTHRYYDDIDIVCQTLEGLAAQVQSFVREGLEAPRHYYIQLSPDRQQMTAVSCRCLPAQRTPGFAGAEVHFGRYPIRAQPELPVEWLVSERVPYDWNGHAMPALSALALLCLALVRFADPKPVRLRYVVDLVVLCRAIDNGSAARIAEFIRSYCLQKSFAKLLQYLDDMAHPVPVLMDAIQQRLIVEPERTFAGIAESRDGLSLRMVRGLHERMTNGFFAGRAFVRDGLAPSVLRWPPAVASLVSGGRYVGFVPDRRFGPTDLLRRGSWSTMGKLSVPAP